MNLSSNHGSGVGFFIDNLVLIGCLYISEIVCVGGKVVTTNAFLMPKNMMSVTLTLFFLFYYFYYILTKLITPSPSFLL